MNDEILPAFRLPAARLMTKLSLPNSFLLILLAIAAGVVFGVAAPNAAVYAKPASEFFIQAVRLLVAPVVFCTVATGIARIRSVREVGQVGIKAALYFETMSALALLAGMGVAQLLQPGAGFMPDSLANSMPQVVGNAAPASLPSALWQTFANSLVLQALIVAVASGLVLSVAGSRVASVVAWLNRATGWLYRAVNLVLRTAPIAAFAAMSYTVGHYGIESLHPLLKFVGSLYLATVLFVAVAMGVVASWCGVNLWQFIVYIKEELVLVFGTASSLAAMPRLMQKLQLAGCSDAVTGLVIPAGYSFNLNGSNVYLGMAAMFIVQAMHVDLRPADYLALFAVAMVTSKSASGVAGSAFAVLAATLAAVPAVPVEGLLLIVGVERLLKCRPLANLIGNGVACLAVAAWCGQFDNRSFLKARQESPDRP